MSDSGDVRQSFGCNTREAFHEVSLHLLSLRRNLRLALAGPEPESYGVP